MREMDISTQNREWAEYWLDRETELLFHEPRDWPLWCRHVAVSALAAAKVGLMQEALEDAAQALEDGGEGHDSFYAGWLRSRATYPHRKSHDD